MQHHQQDQQTQEPHQSSYKGDFAAAAAAERHERARPVRHPDQLQLSTEPMDTWTTSRGAYGGQQQQQQPKQAPPPAAIGAGPIERRQPIRPKGELQVSTAPFAGRTTMQEDFVARQGHREAPVRYPGEINLASEPMAATSTSRDAFTAKMRDGPPPTRRPAPTNIIG